MGESASKKKMKCPAVLASGKGTPPGIFHLSPGLSVLGWKWGWRN